MTTTTAPAIARIFTHHTIHYYIINTIQPSKILNNGFIDAKEIVSLPE